MAETRTKYETIVITIIAPFFALAGIVIGNHLSHRNAQELLVQRQKNELQVRSYARLMGLKLALVQAIQTNLEAKMLSEFYEARYLRLSHNREDLTESKRQYDRALTLIPSASQLLRELFETLGEVMVAYDLDEELSARINDLYHFRGADIQFTDKSIIKTNADLERWKDATNKQIHEILKREFLDRFEALLPLLVSQIRKGR